MRNDQNPKAPSQALPRIAPGDTTCAARRANQPIGSLCLMDMKPRQLTDREKRLLQEYANEVMEEIAKRAPQTPVGALPPRARAHNMTR